MLRWLKSLFQQPRPAGPPKLVRAFGTSSQPLTRDAVSVDQDAWRIEAREGRAVRLFEMAHPGVEECLLTYRAQMKTQNVMGGAYLEMWCRLPGHGEFFSKGLHQKVHGTTGWATYEIPFYLKKGQSPDLIKLNVVTDGPGTIWVKDVELHQTPLK